MNPSDTDILHERIKELTCLYEVSTLAHASDRSFEDILQSIVDRIPHAWRFPEDAVCELSVKEHHLVSRQKDETSCNQQQDICIDDKVIGSISIHYPVPKRSSADFLKEETALLRKLSEEIASIVDRKESRDREESFIQNFQRQDRLSILGEITAGIAHELNTPLGNILGFSQLILDSERNPQTLSDAQKIMNSAIHSREIVKKLMFFSCELPQKYEFVSLNQLVNEALRLLAPSFQKSNIRSLFESGTSDIQVQLDPIQITQVIFNLLINAIHASPENSSISVQIEPRQETVLLVITDEGKGIPEEIREKIFEPFFTTKPVGEGSGLGLSVVHGIIKAHRGTIQVASETGKGTSFTIELPLKQGL